MTARHQPRAPSMRRINLVDASLTTLFAATAAGNPPFGRGVQLLAVWHRRCPAVATPASCRTVPCQRPQGTRSPRGNSMTYLGNGDPARRLTLFDGSEVERTDYRPVWVNNLADDVTIEGSAMNGVAHGAEAVRSIVTSI